MSEGCKSRTGTQTPSSVYLPLRMSSNIPAFANTPVQRSKADLVGDELLVADLTDGDGTSDIKTGLPLQGTEVYNQVDELPSYNSTSGYLDSSYSHLIRRQMTGDYVTVPQYHQTINSKRTWPCRQPASTFQECHTLPQARYGAITPDVYKPGSPTMIERSTTSHPRYFSDKFKQTPLPNGRERIGTYPHTSATPTLVHTDANYKRPFVATKTKYNTNPYGIKNNYNIRSTSGCSSIPCPNTHAYESNLRGNDLVDVEIDQLNTGFKHLSMSNPHKDFSSIPYQTNIRKRNFHPISRTNNTINYRSPLPTNQSTYPTHLDYINGCAGVDNDTGQASLDFKRTLTGRAVRKRHTHISGATGNITGMEKYITGREIYITGRERYIGGDTDKFLCTTRVDRGVSAIAIPMETPIGFSRRLRNPQQQLLIPDEINRGTQSPNLPYMTRLSKYYRCGGQDINIRPSPISSQQLKIQATQFPSLELSGDDVSLEEDMMADAQGIYGYQTLPTDTTKTYTARNYALPDVDQTYLMQRQPLAPELRKDYMAREPSPSNLSRTYSNPTGSRPPLPTVLQPTMNRTVSSPHTFNRTRLALPSSKRSRWAGVTERKYIDLLCKRKTDSSGGGGVLTGLRRASTIDVLTYASDDEPPDIPVHKSHSDSSIDMTDDSTYSPLPSKKLVGGVFRRFRPLPKLHEESTLDAEYDSEKDGEYFPENMVLGKRTPNTLMGRISPLSSEDADENSDPLPRTAGQYLMASRRSQNQSPLRFPPTWEELWQQGISSPGLNVPASETDPVQAWNDANFGNKHDEGELENLTDSMMEDIRVKDSDPSYPTEPELPNVVSTTRMFGQIFQSDSTFNKSDVGLQMVHDVKTKGVQAVKPKMRDLMAFPPRTKKRRVAEEMYKAVNKEFLF